MAMHEGSIASWLATMKIGEHRYVETEYDDYPRMMRNLNPMAGKRPLALQDYEFKTSLYTAIGNGDPRDVRFLVRVERLG